MNRIPYTYCVIRYVHDPVAAEMLNIGVVMWSPIQSFLGIKLEQRFERLSKTFAGFDGDYYRKAIRQLTNAIENMQDRFSNPVFPFDPAPENITVLMRSIWPDEELSFQAGALMAGVTKNLEKELEEIFSRFVDKQYTYPKLEKRSDEDVWSVYSRSLYRNRITRKLHQKTIETSEFSIKFDHAFKNEKWHALEPISLDLKRVEGIQLKATTWLGNATALQYAPDMGTLYLLLGSPKTPGHEKAYIKAKNLLNKMPIPHKLIEEDEAEDFAEHIHSYMVEHGILTPIDE
jgi:hypothetical protein